MTSDVAVRPLFVTQIVDLGVATRDITPAVAWISILVALVVIDALFTAVALFLVEVRLAALVLG